MPTERPFAQGGRSTMKPNTIIAVTSDDARHRPVLDRAVSLANESGATVILYDLDADLGPLMSPLPTEWSGEGEQEQFGDRLRSEEHTSELQSLTNLVCRLLLEKKKL